MTTPRLEKPRRRESSPGSFLFEGVAQKLSGVEPLLNLPGLNPWRLGLQNGGGGVKFNLKLKAKN